MRKSTTPILSRRRMGARLGCFGTSAEQASEADVVLADEKAKLLHIRKHVEDVGLGVFPRNHENNCSASKS